MKLAPFRVLPALALAGLASCGIASAQPNGYAGIEGVSAGPTVVAGRQQPGWGTADAALRTFAGTAFAAAHTSTTYDFDSTTTHRVRTGGEAYFDAALPDLPAGALIVALELEGCDTSASASADAILIRRTGPAGPTNIFADVSTGGPAMPGCGFFLVPVIGPFATVGNLNNYYFVRVALGATDSSTSLGSVRVYYRLQVSLAPAFATFNDVPTDHPFFRFIEALAASEITAGCGSGNFCPDLALTRGQMAVFLSIALGLHFPS
jgi:hypothetical protein